MNSVYEADFNVALSQEKDTNPTEQLTEDSLNLGNYDDDNVVIERGSHYVSSPECAGTRSVDQAGIKSVHHYAEQFFWFYILRISLWYAG